MFPKIELIFGAVLLATVSTAAAAQTAIQVAKTRGCGCCVAWMDRLSDAGFLPEGEKYWGSTDPFENGSGYPCFNVFMPHRNGRGLHDRRACATCRH